MKKSKKIRKEKLESHKNKDFCNVVMPSEDTKILQFNQYKKSDNALFIIYYLCRY